jgi:hypothetical protein
MRTAGYTSKNPLAPNVLKDHPLISGWKQILVHEVFSEFYLLTFIDEWGDSGGMSRFELSNTFGERIILWYMQYKGTYPKKVIQFLKSALAAGYEEENFSVQREDENFIVLCVPNGTQQKEVVGAANHMRPVIGGWRLSGSPQDCKYDENKSHFSLQKE